jgi:C-5 cytosine-specific DNA methylase
MDELLVYDLYCGLGGWSEGFLAEGYRCVGYDIEAHDYGTGGYPGELRLRDVRSIHGSELKDATCIVGSSPCQEFSYRAMPWKRAKALGPPLLGIELFNAQFRIQREACEAAGRHIPMVVENVRGAQMWVGKAQWHYGSFYLWGDVPALMPMTLAAPKVAGFRFDGSGKSFQTAAVEGQKVPGIPPHPREDFGWNHSRELQDSRKHDGSGWTEKGSLASHNRLVSNQAGRKVPGIKLSEVGFNVAAAQRYRKSISIGGTYAERKARGDISCLHSHRSDSRKAASAMIAKIPFPLSSHIARCFLPHG